MDTLPLWAKWAGVVLGSGILTVAFNTLASWAGLWTDTRSNLQDTLMERVHALEDRVARMQEEQSSLRILAVRLWHAYQTQKERIKRLLSGYNEMRKEKGLDPINADEIHVEIDTDTSLDDITDIE